MLISMQQSAWQASQGEFRNGFMHVHRFDTMGVQGQDFKAELLGPNSKPSKGLRKANLSPRTKALLEEIALSEQVMPFPLAHAPL